MSSLPQLIQTVSSLMVSVGMRPVTGNNSYDGAQNMAKFIIQALYDAIGAYRYTGFYDPTTSTPSSPSLGQSYISLSTANGWTKDYVYSYNGASWDEQIPEEGTLVWLDNLDQYWSFDGATWQFFTGGSTSPYNGIPVYTDHASAPIPVAGYVTQYFLTGDYNFIYFKWSDGSRHNRRLPLSFETDE